MITQRMTLEEIFREMKAEEYEVKDKMFSEYRMNQLRRMSMKHRDCTVSDHFFVNTSRKNRYACIMSVNSWKDFCKNNIHQYLIVIYNTDKGKYAATRGYLSTYSSEQLMLFRYQPHFFSRYAERTGLNLTGEALIMHYFARNNMSCLQIDPLRRNPDEVFSATVDGLSLGYLEGIGIKFNTFIPYDGLGKTKNEISQQEVEHLRGLMTAKYGSFVKTEAQMPFFTDADLMLAIIEKDLGNTDIRPSERNTRTFAEGDHRNALFEFAVRKSVSDNKPKQ